MRREWKLAVVGFFFHAPGQRLISRTRLSVTASWCNAVALSATLLGVIGAWSASRNWNHVALTWLAGHLV